MLTVRAGAARASAVCCGVAAMATWISDAELAALDKAQLAAKAAGAVQAAQREAATQKAKAHAAELALEASAEELEAKYQVRNERTARARAPAHAPSQPQRPTSVPARLPVLPTLLTPLPPPRSARLWAMNTPRSRRRRAA